VSIWLDDHLWKVCGLTDIEIATHRGRIRVELEPHKQYWRYINCGWKPASEAMVKLDRKHRQLLICLVFRKSTVEYDPRDFISADVNENHEAVLVDSKVYLLETEFKDIALWNNRNNPLPFPLVPLLCPLDVFPDLIHGPLKQKPVSF
jgi:hypothetical protein